jgi:predicted GNAT superfamily acetyltransferase
LGRCPARKLFFVMEHCGCRFLAYKFNQNQFVLITTTSGKNYGSSSVNRFGENYPDFFISKQFRVDEWEY